MAGSADQSLDQLVVLLLYFSELLHSHHSHIIFLSLNEVSVIDLAHLIFPDLIGAFGFNALKIIINPLVFLFNQIHVMSHLNLKFTGNNRDAFRP